jgi:predicted PurR-regulated permease PerM
MVDFDVERPTSRARLGWWAFVLALGAAAAFLVHAFVGIAVLGTFGYYATRPIYERVKNRIGSDGLAASATLLLVTLPVILLLFYAGFQVFTQLQGWLGGGASLPVFGGLSKALGGGGGGGGGLRSLLQNPQQLLSAPGQSARQLVRMGGQAAAALFNGLVVLALALALAFFFLKNDDDLAAGLRELFGGRDTTAHAYASAVDADLESVFFGNFLFVVVMAVIAAIVYLATSFLAPAGISVPIPLALAALTGVASLIPVVVGKVVYVPLVAYLAFQAFRTGGSNLLFVGGVLVVYVLVLDLLPQAFIQPYITGQQLNMVVMMFAYILGPMLFGWWGFFFLPILFVVIAETVRIILPELVSGRPLTPTASMGQSLGADLPSARRSRTDDSSAGENSAGGED